MSDAADLSYIAGPLRPLAVPCDSLVLDPANARRHPEPNLDAIAGSLHVYGQQKPVVVRKGNRVVIAGNGTLEAARRLGWTHVAAVFADMDAATAAGFAVADNRSSDLSSFDSEALDRLLREVNTGGDPRLDAMLAELREESGLTPDAKAGGSGEPPVTEEDEGYEDEDGLDLLFKSPYPWFGGKARVAGAVWKRFGDLKGYVEPFFGSGAVFLNRPQPFAGNETINDRDCMICNFWRAVRADPGAVAEHADWPVIASDLHARHAWLVTRKEDLQARLEGDPDYFDPKVAGWWCWGLSLWIGSGFCAGNGPWQVVEAEDGTRQLVRLSGAGQGVNRQLVHLGNAGQGVNRQLVHLGGAGRGVNRQRVQLSGAGQGVNRKLVHLSDAGRGGSAGSPEGNAGTGECGLLAWMEALSARLRRVRICCDDWTSVCGGRSGDALSHFFATGEPCGVFLDPPYKLATDDGQTREACYNTDGADTNDIAEAVRRWAVRHGDDPRLRIALCGYGGEHALPPSWECLRWKAHGGMAVLAVDDDTQGKRNRFRERVWFSPHCLRVAS